VLPFFESCSMSASSMFTMTTLASTWCAGPPVSVGERFGLARAGGGELVERAARQVDRVVRLGVRVSIQVRRQAKPHRHAVELGLDGPTCCLQGPGEEPDQRHAREAMVRRPFGRDAPRDEVTVLLVAT
jgi:hypothetical protein